MGKRFIINILVAAVLIISIALSGCVEETENKIIIGTSADYPPFEYVEGGEIVGFDIEMVTTLLENLDYTVEVQDIGFDSLIPSLQSGKIDVIAAAMTITDERDQQIDFSDPYYESDQSVLTLVVSGFEISGIDDLTNLKVGVQTGTTGELWVWDNLINITNATMTDDQLKRYDTYTLAVLDLDNGNIDAIVLDKPVGYAFAEDEDREVAYAEVTGEFLGLGVQEGNIELVEGLNEELEKLIGSEEWNALLTKYFE